MTIITGLKNKAKRVLTANRLGTGVEKLPSIESSIEFINSVLKNCKPGERLLDKTSYMNLLNEVIYNQHLAQTYESNLPIVRRVNPKHPFNSWKERSRTKLFIGSVNLIYIITRLLKPKVIIETGCATGFTTALFLAAVEKNCSGFLYSIDLPNKEGKAGFAWPEDVPIGYLVPEAYKKNWKLILGSSIKELPELFEKTKDVDLFFHDSCHTYEHMTFEYAVAEHNMRSGACIISDDILSNRAFKHYFQERGKKVFVNPLNKNMGLAILS